MGKRTKIAKLLTIILLSISQFVTGQLPVPEDIGNSHPRCFGKSMEVEQVQQLVEKEVWAERIIKKKKEKISKYLSYCENDPDWLVSRLQMYWNSKHMQVYINGGTYSHAEGEAPVPTVRYPGTRGHTTEYKRPDLEDIKPFMDDPKGLFLQHKKRPDQWEWAPIPETGRIIESINREILTLARDAAFIYWYTKDEAYVKLAYDVLDTYLMGINYLKEPIDISHGHHQTLVGYTSFEVIQEHILSEITQCYDFLYSYVKKENPEKLTLYAKILQKWADQIIKNGVSFNNWNLLQAFHVAKIALVLENNSSYNNRKGCQYYLDQIMNQTSVRQWSMQKLIDYGYDLQTGIWNESPGYAMNVLNDFIHFAEFYDRNFDIDLIQELPVLSQAVKSSAQYLSPNQYMVAFGDGYYKKLSPEAIFYMIENAQKYDKSDQEDYFTNMMKTLFDADVYSEKYSGYNLDDLFQHTAVKIKENIPGGQLNDLVSPVFYAPNASWIVQRQGKGDTGLMISQIGSQGNHMHSNGIAMELYGYGLPLAPEMGHGASYFSIEYAEYYTQFPAHNTVIVNGKSKYPEMKSNHGFEVVACYPGSRQKEGVFSGLTFSDVVFLEPETNSDQRRVMGIILNGEETGYYIDVFRSRQNTGNNLKHEYFYHNLGQSLSLTKADGSDLQLTATEKLAFGNGDLMAYDYLWDKRSVQTNNDFRGNFSLTFHEKSLSMNFWIKGEDKREVFSVFSPKSTAIKRMELPVDLKNAPIPALIVRQEGEAWTKPFVAVYEPCIKDKSTIQSINYFGEEERVGIQVNNKSGRTDYIFSNTKANQPFSFQNMRISGTYGIILINKKNFSLFLGNGHSIQMGQYQLELTEENGRAILFFQDNNWYLETQKKARLTLPLNQIEKKTILTDVNGNIYEGIPDAKNETISFELPALSYGPVKFNSK